VGVVGMGSSLPQAEREKSRARISKKVKMRLDNSIVNLNRIDRYNYNIEKDRKSTSPVNMVDEGRNIW
jgi:type IV secretory pathway VirB9-like protein